MLNAVQRACYLDRFLSVIPYKTGSNLKRNKFCWLIIAKNFARAKNGKISPSLQRC